MKNLIALLLLLCASANCLAASSSDLGSTIYPYSKKDAESVKERLDQISRGASHNDVAIVPKISTLTLSLSPGSQIPILRTTTNQSSSMTFSDNNGQPWILAAPPTNGNPNGFQVTYIPNSNILTVQAKRLYDTGNITVYLKGLDVPVVINLSSGEPDSNAETQVIDARLDIRLPMRSPDDKTALPNSKIGLYNSTLQSILDGVPPKDAKKLSVSGINDTTAYAIKDQLYIRTTYDLRDEFTQTLSSPDGTKVFQLPMTPIVTFSVQGQTIDVQIGED